MASSAAKLKILAEIPGAYRAQCAYALRCLSQIWGIGIELFYNCDQAHEAHIVYSERVKSLRSDKQMFIPFNASLYQKSTVCDCAEYQGHKIWRAKGVEAEFTDLIASSFRLLTMLDELQIPAKNRDQKGNFYTNVLPPDRRQTLAFPLVDDQATLIFKKIVETFPLFNGLAIPLWPEKKKIAVCVSHDTDATRLGNLYEMIYLLGKVVFRRDSKYVSSLAIALKHFGKNPDKDPYWGFPGWRETESAKKIKSCFYLAAPPRKCKRHINDCRSTVFDRKTDWKLLRDMADAGWEFGLHPAIHATNEEAEFVDAKHRIEEKLQRQIFGIRHHYLAFNQYEPWKTFKQHADAGFLYDSSIGWRDAAGFRAGTSFPFPLFDYENNRTLQLLELPMTIMDGHILESGKEALDAAKAVLERTIEHGGMLMLNWHTQSFTQMPLYEGYLKMFEQMLDLILYRDDVWFATPLGVARWWSERNTKLLDQKIS